MNDFEDFIFKDNNYNRDDYFSENIETYFIGIKGTISKGLTRYFNKINSNINNDCIIFYKKNNLFN